MAGLGIAPLGLFISHANDNPVWDGVATIHIGMVLVHNVFTAH